MGLGWCGGAALALWSRASAVEPGWCMGAGLVLCHHLVCAGTRRHYVMWDTCGFEVPSARDPQLPSRRWRIGYHVKSPTVFNSFLSIPSAVLGYEVP